MFQRLGQQFHIVGKRRHNIAVAPFVVKGDRQLLDPYKQLSADLVHNALCRAGHKQIAQILTHRDHNDQNDHNDHILSDRTDISCFHHSVDDGREHAVGRNLRGGRQDDQQQADEKDQLVVAVIRKEAADGVHRSVRHDALYGLFPCVFFGFAHALINPLSCVSLISL